MNIIERRQRQMRNRRILLITLAVGVIIFLVAALAVTIVASPLPGNQLPPDLAAEDFLYNGSNCTAFRQESRVVGVVCW